VDSDTQQYHSTFTDAEKHGISTVLKLFTTYEVHVADYWIDVVYKWFPKPEVRAMAQMFSAMEAEHALFYDRLNNALGLSNEEFYLEFTKNQDMSERVKFIEEMIAKGDGSAGEGETFEQNLATSLAAFAFVEGVILYSSFAFLLSFPLPPKGKLKNVSAGLSYSVRDEALHAQADAWLFRTFVEENKDKIDQKSLEESIKDIANSSLELENKIIDQIFSEGEIDDISAKDLKEFVKSRVNIMLSYLNIEPMYEIGENPISKWFYKSINAPEQTDFFVQNPSSYTNDWNFDDDSEEW
jgi:ribonucleoside-diphosphate reductase beta chain